jgi:LPXTG-motif cell wall-anchored protein
MATTFRSRGLALFDLVAAKNARCPQVNRPEETKPYTTFTMDTNTLIIIILVVLLLGGGGLFYRRR